MVVEAPIIDITDRANRAGRAGESTLRFWRSGRPAARGGPHTAPIRRNAAEPGRRYPINPLLRARFGAGRESHPRVRMALAALAIMGFVATGVVALATVRTTAPTSSAGNDQLAEVLPLDPPELGFEFARALSPVTREAAPPPATPPRERNPIASGDADTPANGGDAALVYEPIAENPY